ncbi:uncharacterized protein METZ01_LOCUS445508 [marine metagenome]|uniref:Uncharacterized protein n=1 Tax=marine metagenome TaxID=408172 RepID=A0A382ZAX1_9ZZZZ
MAVTISTISAIPATNTIIHPAITCGSITLQTAS